MAEAHTRARGGDPDTSHDAAAAIGGHLPFVQQRVLDYFKASSRGLTQHEVIRAYRREFPNAAESTVRTRVAELVDKGLLRDSGRRELNNRREVIIWELVV